MLAKDLGKPMWGSNPPPPLTTGINMKSLLEIFSTRPTNHYFTTPMPQTDKGTVHSYIEWYNEILDPYRNCNYMLEIGIWNGSSIDLWRRYFDANTKIFGMDFNPRLYDDEVEIYKEQNVFLKQSIDAYTHDAISWLLEQTKNEKFDVIIDDGSHLMQHNIWILNHYGKIVNKGGILIIEDIDVYQRRAGDILQVLEDTMKHVEYEYEYYEIVDRRHIKNRADDILFVVKF
jgi:predicted O-methyltransferase YrrM